MKRYSVYAIVATVMLSLSVAEVQAKRMGGGSSVGRQSPNVTQRDSMPSSPGPSAGSTAPAAGGQAMPAQAARPAAAAPAAAAAAQPARSRWLAPLAGIAAGLGLAALASHFGFGEGLAQFMLVMLLVMVGVFIFRMLRSRKTVTRANPYQPAFSYNGVGQEASVSGYTPAPAPAARPVSVVRPASGLAEELSPSTAWRVPDEFDRDGFLNQAKAQYVRLQRAYDKADLKELSEFTSADMFSQLKKDIDARQGAANQTDVVTLNGELLGISSNSIEHLASVRFHGMVREAEGAAAEPFDEVWNLVKPVDGSTGWVLAGIQPLN